MAIVKTDNAHYSAIADAIRSMGWYSDLDTFTPAEMASAITTSHEGMLDFANSGYDLFSGTVTMTVSGNTGYVDVGITIGTYDTVIIVPSAAAGASKTYYTGSVYKPAGTDTVLAVNFVSAGWTYEGSYSGSVINWYYTNSYTSTYDWYLIRPK